MAPKRPAFDYEAQWGDPAGLEEMTLPSGKQILVRPPALSTMAKHGLIPAVLLPTVEKFVLGGMRELLRELPELGAPGAEPGATLIRKGELEDYINVVCVASVYRPKLSFDGKPDTIDVTWLSSDDRFAIWDRMVGLNAALARFRELADGAVQLVADLPHGEGVRDAAEPDDRPDAA